LKFGGLILRAHPSLPLVGFNSSYHSGAVVSKAKIFVIEDQPLMRQAFSALFSGAGYDVAQAVSGEEALELAPSVRPDAVTINFHLPDTDGVSLAEKLRRLPGLETTPFILITSQNLPGNCAETPLPHVDGYINKEDLIDHLLPCIEQHLGR
jgi:CheY-like chemotaxis protein